MYDLTMPYLAKRVNYVWDSGEATSMHVDSRGYEHGTAVALLVLLVAPDAELSIYPTMAHPGPTIATVSRAIDAAAASQATILNISQGVQTELPDLKFELMPDLGLGLMDHLREWLDQVAPDGKSCEICIAAQNASIKQMVFAAAGNDAHMIYCPARAKGVISAGFQRSERSVIEGPNIILEVASSASTGRQSPTWDISLEEFSGILGTSFASPLFAGVAALGVSYAEYRAYISVIQPGGIAQMLHMELRSSSEKSVELVNATHTLYLEALKRLPHVHCKVDADLRPDVPFMEPTLCWSCGVFGRDIYINGGLFYLEIGDTDAALSLLIAGRDLAPWSPDAFANLGAAFRVLGNLAAAEGCYEKALELRPGFEVYTRTLDEIRHTSG